MDELESLLIERACSRPVALASEHADHHRPANRITRHLLTNIRVEVLSDADARAASFPLHG